MEGITASFIKYILYKEGKNYLFPATSPWRNKNPVLPSVIFLSNAEPTDKQVTFPKF